MSPLILYLLISQVAGFSIFRTMMTASGSGNAFLDSRDLGENFIIDMCVHVCVYAHVCNAMEV